MASLALDSSVAMRIRFEGATPPARALYFRGPVLSTFDGQEWRPLRSSFPSRFQPTAQLQVNGTAYRYQVTLEANNRPWIVVLDATPDKPAINGYTASMGADLQWTADRPMTDLVRYSAESFPDFRYGPLRAVAALQDYLDLPPNFDPRTRLLATELLRDPRALDGASALVDLVLERLRTGGYTYTLEPGVFGIHTADEFWFDRKEGFCEHIASSFVVLMRAMGVAARVVTGYQGGEVNNVDGFWTVRQSDAHAWAEVWIAGRGWLRVDPTSSVAPGRTGSLQRLVVPQGAMAQVLGAVSPALVLNLREAWEALNNRWNQWVLNYSQAKQLDLLRNIGFESPSWQDLSYALIGVIVLASIMGALWTLWERHRQDPWLRLLHQAVTRLKRMGVAVPATAPPRSIATQLSQHAGLAASPITPALVNWLLRLEAWRYAPHDQRAKLSALRREFNQLPWPPRRT
jgi:transglutaminase-like putative cysteine protease